MQYLHAALLLHSSNQDITEKSIENIIKAAGIEPDEAKIKSLVAALADVDIDDVLSKASMTAMPVAAVASDSGSSSIKEATESKEEEEEEEEGDDLGLSSLFG